MQPQVQSISRPGESRFHEGKYISFAHRGQSLTQGTASLLPVRSERRVSG